MVNKSRRAGIVVYDLVIHDQIHKEWGERDIYSTWSIHLELHSKRQRKEIDSVRANAWFLHKT